MAGITLYAALKRRNNIGKCLLYNVFSALFVECLVVSTKLRFA